MYDNVHTGAFSTILAKEQDLDSTEALLLRRYSMNILIYKYLQRSRI
jgi:hypothetical protein